MCPGQLVHWSHQHPPFLPTLQPRWRACYATAAPTLNPLDQVAIPEPETTPQGSQQYKKKKKDPRFKFQEKGVFGENLYTKGFSENLHISPHKLNDMVKVLRGQSIHDAIIQCQVRAAWVTEPHAWCMRGGCEGCACSAQLVKGGRCFGLKGMHRASKVRQCNAHCGAALTTGLFTRRLP